MPHDKPKNYREIRHFGSYIKSKAKRRPKDKTEIKKEPSKYSGHPFGQKKIRVKGRLHHTVAKREPYHTPPRVYSEPTEQHVNTKSNPQVYSEPTQAHIHSSTSKGEVYSRPTNPQKTREETKQ